MPTEATAPIAGLPDFDPKADRGSDFVPEAPAPVIELTVDELKLIGKGPAEAVEPPAKAPETPAVVEDTTKAAEPVVDPAAVKEDPPRDDKGKFIPKARFDEVNNKAKAKVAALEAKIAQMEARTAPAAGAPDTTALETQLTERTKEYTQFVVDGDLDKANEAMAAINKINRQIGNLEAAAISGEHAAETQNVDTLGEMVALYKEAYPMFDDSLPDVYDQTMVDYVARLQAKFEQTGSSPAEALREAVELTVAKYGLASGEEPAAATPAVPEDKGEKRKEAAVDTALRAANRQPPSTASVGADSDKAGMSKISTEQIQDYATFEALAKNESTLKRLRGDFA